MSAVAKCWLFTYPVKPNGYAQVWEGSRTTGRRRVYVHRRAYEILVGPIPDGMEIDHTCNRRNCYNPAHLEPVLHAENMRRGATRRRRAK